MLLVHVASIIVAENSCYIDLVVHGILSLVVKYMFKTRNTIEMIFLVQDIECFL